MTLTIREALKFGGLFGSVVVAGKDGLDAPIESVSVLEIADSRISHWVVQNQLYITSFYAIRDNVMQQEVVIRELKKNGCCGLVLCNVGMLLQQIDERILKRCDTCSFPLIQARANVSYIEIMNPIMDTLFKNNTITPAENNFQSVRDEFLDLIVNEDETERILRKMNKRYDKQISYYDIYGNCIYSNFERDYLELEKEYLKENFNHILYGCSQKGYVELEIDGRDKLVVLIRSSKNLFGILITDYVEVTGELETGFIQPLILSCALLFSRRDRIKDLRDKVKKEFVTDLLVWNFPTQDAAIQRSNDVKLRIDDKNRMILININSMRHVQDSKLMHEMQDYVERLLIPRAESLMKSCCKDNWLVLRSDTIIVLINSRVASFHIKEFSERLLHIFPGTLGLSVSLGVSDEFTQLKEIPEAYMQAYQAAIIGRQHYGENRVVFYDQVWFFKKLQELGEKKETERACFRFLEPLRTYDDMHGTCLVETLRCLLLYNGNIMDAADHLYIHKNTMLQRKNKIVKLLGYSPLKMPHILNFMIIFDILVDRSDTK